jgi:hypothetical protein
MQAEEFVRLLKGTYGKSPSWRAICPAHRSKENTRSLSIKETRDGSILMRCFAGCDVVDITSAVGVDLRDLMPDGEGKGKRGMFRREALARLNGDLMLAWVFLQDVSSGRPIKPGDRAKARECARRLSVALQEIAG